CGPGTGTLPAEIGQFSEDIKFSLKLLLRQQIKDISAGLAPSSKIAVEGLSPSERHLLKAIQGRIKNLEPLIQACLFDR
ncbi:MAG: putative nucleotidyltransferase substrate binding domain-containing protein, partial [Candidatus Puniceispirillaceae bacterium]